MLGPPPALASRPPALWALAGSPARRQLEPEVRLLVWALERLRVVRLEHRVAEQVDARRDTRAHHWDAVQRRARLLAGDEAEVRRLAAVPRHARVDERRDLHRRDRRADQPEPLDA